jgi:putative transposase
MLDVRNKPMTHYAAQEAKQGELIKVNHKVFSCKICGSYNVIRDGYVKGNQRRLCNSCHHKFIDNDAPPGMKTPTNQISSALNMYYKGIPLKAICRHLFREYRNCPSDSTVHEWIRKFSRRAIEKDVDYKPQVGDVWAADETALYIGGENVWLWDIIDTKTRFLLTSHMSTKRTVADVQTLVEKAQKKAGKIPRVILTDKLNAHFEVVERAWRGDTKHIASQGFRESPNTKLIKHLHSALEKRTKVMSALKDVESAKQLMRAWLVHYNFFSPQNRLRNVTPAQKAGVALTYNNWVDLVNSSRRPMIRSSIHELERPLLLKFSPSEIEATRVPRISLKKPRKIPDVIYVSTRANGTSIFFSNLQIRKLRGASLHF